MVSWVPPLADDLGLLTLYRSSMMFAGSLLPAGDYVYLSVEPVIGARTLTSLCHPVWRDNTQ